MSNALGDESCCVVIKDTIFGVILVGEYSKVLHASAAVRSVGAARLCVTGYCGGPILRKTGAI